MQAHTANIVYAAAFGIGIVAGMRSLLAPGTTAATLWQRPDVLTPDAPARWLAIPQVAIILACLAIGELIADKLPSIPDRIAPGPLVARLVSGGVCGATLAQVGHASATIGALAGAAAAILSAFGAYHARQWIDRATGIPDPYVGALEDVIALAIAATALLTVVGG